MEETRPISPFLDPFQWRAWGGPGLGSDGGYFKESTSETRSEFKEARWGGPGLGPDGGYFKGSATETRSESKEVRWGGPGLGSDGGYFKGSAAAETRSESKEARWGGLGLDSDGGYFKGLVSETWSKSKGTEQGGSMLVIDSFASWALEKIIMVRKIAKCFSIFSYEIKRHS